MDIAKSLVALQTYPNSPRLLENAVCLLSNLMFGNDDNKLEIGSTCGDEIVNVIRVSCCGENPRPCVLSANGFAVANVGFSPALRPPIYLGCLVCGGHPGALCGW